MCDPIERAAQRAARIAELNAVQTTHGDDDHGGDDERTSGRKEKTETMKAKIRSPPEADSDATTVPAKTPEAQRMAAQSFAAAQVQEQDKAKPGTVTHSNTPSLKREVQSQELLTEEPERKQLRRMQGHELKQSPSSEQVAVPKTAVATAVKAKAAPPAAAPKEEAIQKAKAVAECLQRSSTQDLEATQAEQNKPEEPKETAKPLMAKPKTGGPPGQPPPPGPDPDPESSDSEDSDEERRKAALLRAKREAHARYMRFSRSLTSKKTPPEIRAAGRTAFRDTEKLQLLMEQWTQCQGMWQQSDFFIQLKQKKRNRVFGCRRWMCRAEIIQKFGDQEVARQLIEAKLQLDEPAKSTQVRANPDLHGLDTEETRQYLIWDREGGENTVDEVATSLFQAAEKGLEGDGDQTQTQKKKKASKKKKVKGKNVKKNKKKSTSSSKSSISSSKSSGSSDGSSSSSDSESNKGKKRKTKGQDGKNGKRRHEKDETEAEKAKRLQKEAEAEQKRKDKEAEADQKKKDKDAEAAQKKKEKEEEAQKKKQEKVKTDALKKEQRKGTQLTNKLGSMIYTAASLDEKLGKLSDHVVKAIEKEVQPHISAMKAARAKLQTAIDTAKVDDYGDLPDEIRAALTVLEAFDSFCKAYKIK